MPMLVLLASGFSRAETANDLLERLRRAEAATTLNQTAATPYYLKIDAQLYDEAGKPKEKGTIEQWWLGGDTDKTIYTFPSYTATQVRKGQVLFGSPGTSQPPALLPMLVNQFVHPFTRLAEVQASQLQLKKVKLGGVPLECVTVAQRSQFEGPPGEYCFDVGKDFLRLSFSFGDLIPVRDGMGTFEGKVLPLDVTVRSGSGTAATAHLSALTTKASSSEISTEGLPDKTYMGGDGTRVVLLHKVEPKYPEEAIQEHLQGTVQLQGVVGIDGRVHDIQVLSSTSQIFTKAAQPAFSQYVFKPYVVDGIPQKFEVSVEINFSMN
jgi:TonB family protein